MKGWTAHRCESIFSRFEDLLKLRLCFSSINHLFCSFYVLIKDGLRMTLSSKRSISCPLACSSEYFLSVFTLLQCRR